MRKTLALLALIISTSASATVVDIDTYLTGVPVANNTTVATFEFHQNGVNVDFSLTNQVGNLNLGAGAFLSQLQFSYLGSLGGTPFSNFSNGTGGTQPISASSFTINPNGQNAGYDFFLDLRFPTSNNQNRFLNGEIATWTINNVLASDFTHPIAGSGIDALALVHVQGLSNGGSVKMVGVQDVEINPTAVVTEPGTVALMGLGLLGLGFVSRKYKNKVMN